APSSVRAATVLCPLTDLHRVRASVRAGVTSASQLTSATMENDSWGSQFRDHLWQNCGEMTVLADCQSRQMSRPCPNWWQFSDEAREESIPRSSMAEPRENRDFGWWQKSSEIASFSELS